MTPVALAVACLLASGLLDLVFKLYVLKSGSRGLLIAGVAIIWGSFQVLLMITNNISFTTDNVTLFYGGCAAVALAVSNLALLECLARLPISIASTIYRLNTIPLVLMAAVFLSEDLDGFRIAGVVLGLITVVLLHVRSTDANQSPNHLLFWFCLIVFASCVRAGYGILTKAGLNAGANAESMMILAASGWLIGGIFYFAFVESRQKIYLGSIRLIALAGVLVFSVVWLLTKALSLGDASIVLPVANMGFVAAFVFSLLWKFEHLTLRKTLAIFTAIVSVALLANGI